MRFIGIDLAWKVRPPKEKGTGFCFLDENGRVSSVGLLTTDREVLDLVGEEEAWVGIDASLRVPRGKKVRACERAVRSRGMRILPTDEDFYRRHYGGCRGESLARRLEARGYTYFGAGRKALFEAYPRAVVQAISPEVPRYKKGPRARRSSEADRLLRQLGEWEPRLQLPGSTMPALVDGRGAADRLDALLAAVLLYRHRLYAGNRSAIVGDEDDGYILLPGGQGNAR